MILRLADCEGKLSSFREKLELVAKVLREVKMREQKSKFRFENFCGKSFLGSSFKKRRLSELLHKHAKICSFCHKEDSHNKLIS